MAGKWKKKMIASADRRCTVRKGDGTCPDNFGVINLQSQSSRPCLFIDHIVQSCDLDARRGSRRLGNLIPRDCRQRNFIRRQKLSIGLTKLSATRYVTMHTEETRASEKGYRTSQSPLLSSTTGTKAVTPVSANPSVIALAIFS